jgi:hypothetical protein
MGARVNQFAYRIYYEWTGKTKSDPFAREKTQTEIETALREFPLELRHRLPDQAASLTTTEVHSGATEVNLAIATVASEEQATAALTTTLQSWSLFGDRLSP